MKKRKLRFPIRIKVQRLHLFTDGYDTYAAFDANDAIDAWKEYTGETKRDEDSEEFEQIPDREIFRIGSWPEDWEETKKDRPLFSKCHEGKDGYHPGISARAWMWALHNGRGFVCSTEY